MSTRTSRKPATAPLEVFEVMLKRFDQEDPNWRAKWKVQCEQLRAKYADEVKHLAAHVQAILDPWQKRGLDPLNYHCWIVMGKEMGVDVGSMNNLSQVIDFIEGLYEQEEDRLLVEDTKQRIKDAVAREVKREGPESTPIAETPQKPKTKRSTKKGDATAKIIPALTKHHKYADGGCLNFEPIGVHELARLAGYHQASQGQASQGPDPTTVVAFFKREFGRHGDYKAMCFNNSRLLIRKLRKLNNEEVDFTSQYDENHRDED